MATFGESREFPAFFSHQSGFQAPHQVQNEDEAAQMIGELLEGQGAASVREVGVEFKLVAFSVSLPKVESPLHA